MSLVFPKKIKSITLCITKISVQEIWLQTNILELLDCFPTTLSFSPNNPRINKDHNFLIKKMGLYNFNGLKKALKKR